MAAAISEEERIKIGNTAITEQKEVAGGSLAPRPLDP